MGAVFEFLVKTVGRVLLPISFLIACIISPISMFSNILNWPAMIADMWNDPF